VTYTIRTIRAIRYTVLILALLVAAGTGIAECGEGHGSHPFTALAATTRAAPARFPVILVVSRAGAIRLMQQGDWCTRQRPGVFECTPATPFYPSPSGRQPAAWLITHPAVTR
jgi:hypothetical protein